MSIADIVIPKAYATAPTLDKIPDLIVNLLDKIWPFITLALFGMLLYGGAMWLMSAGDPQKVQKAQGTILWAVIGAIVLALIMVIIGLLENVFGVNLRTISF